MSINVTFDGDGVFTLNRQQSTKILGAASYSVATGEIRADEFIRELRGRKAIKKYREMRDNDATIGAVMYAVEQMLRDVPLNIAAADETSEATQGKEFLEQVLEDMEHTLDDHVSEALSYLSYGFSTFEVVYKLRQGPKKKNPSKRSKYSDGYYGIRKLAVRAPWNVLKFEVDKHSGDILGIHQDGLSGGSVMIPANKLVHYKTTTLNGEPSGRSVLRNSFTSYEYLNTAQVQEAIGIERDLSGIPIIKVPSEYLSEAATDDQKAVVEVLKRIGSDLKNNEQAFALLPSDTYTDSDGKPSNIPMVDIKLMGSDSSRTFNTDTVIRRYQHDIARSLLSEFILLGGGSTGSYALSKSKTDLFLRALESYIQTIVDVLNKQLVEKLWQINGFDLLTMPKIVAGDVAPHDLKELGAYLRNLNGADISLADQVHIVDALLDNAELPKLDKDIYAESRERAYAADEARNDYYNGPDDPPLTVESEPEEDEVDA